PGDLLTPSRRRKPKRDLWRVRGHLVSNRDPRGPKFFNAINSLCRIGRGEDALREARERHKQRRGIAGKNSAISAAAVPESGPSSASPSRAWVRASLGPKPLPTGNRFDRKRACAA